MYDKAKLGGRYTCFQCGTKFYDLNREVPACPECGADQRDAPARDVRSLLSGRGRPRPKPEDDEMVIDQKDKKNGDEEDEFDSLDDADDEEDEV